jgi:hypothetical protein
MTETNTLPVKVDQHTAADVAIQKYKAKYGGILSAPALTVLASPVFAKFVADTQVTVIGGHALDHLEAASDEAVSWCLGMMEVLIATRSDVARRLLWPASKDIGVSL